MRSAGEQHEPGAKTPRFHVAGELDDGLEIFDGGAAIFLGAKLESERAGRALQL